MISIPAHASPSMGVRAASHGDHDDEAEHALRWMTSDVPVFRAAVGEPISRWAHAGPATGNPDDLAYLVQGESGRRYVVSHRSRVVSADGWSVVARGRPRTVAQAEAEGVVWRPPGEIPNSVAMATASIGPAQQVGLVRGHGDEFLVRQPHRTVLVHREQTSDGRWRATIVAQHRDGPPRDVNSHEIHVGDHVRDGQGQTWRVTGVREDGTLESQTDSGSRVSLSPWVTTLVPTPAPAPPAVGAANRPSGDHLPGWDVRVGDRVAHIRGPDAQGRPRVGIVEGWRRDHERLRVRLDDGREAQWSPYTTRFADRNDPRAGFGGRVQTAEGGAAPSRGASASSSTAPAADLTPHTPLGNRGWAYELEYMHQNRASAWTAVPRALHEQGVPETQLGYRGYYHGIGLIPFYKIEHDPTVDDEFITPILGNGTFTYGNTNGREIPEAELVRNPEQAAQEINSGYAHTTRHFDTEDAQRQMRAAMEAIRQSGGRPGRATSFHLNMNLSDYRALGEPRAVEAIKRIVKFYAMNFDLLNNFLPPSRVGSSWAGRPTSYMLDAIERARTLDDIETATGNNHGTALNLGHVTGGGGGRIEFRAMGNTLDPNQTQAWHEAMAALMEAAKGDAIVQHFNTFGELLGWLKDNGGLRQEVVDYAQAQSARRRGSIERTTRQRQAMEAFRAGARRSASGGFDIVAGSQILVRGRIYTVTRTEMVPYTGGYVYGGRNRDRVRAYYRIANGQERSITYYPWSTPRHLPPESQAAAA